jgi:hypothetical protein
MPSMPGAKSVLFQFLQTEGLLYYLRRSERATDVIHQKLKDEGRQAGWEAFEQH